MSFILALVGFGLVAPIIGCLLAGLDRKITARLQGRVGPPLLQPYYDVRKLLAKENVSVNRFQDFYIAMSLFLAILAGVMFFAGGNFLLVVFLITLSTLFLIVAAYSSRSPFAEIGAEREIIQVMSYEPLVILMTIAYFLAVRTFDVGAVFGLSQPIIVSLPLVFIAFLFVLTIKLRKSPFDLSYSHHAHQELVKGITTEMSGKTLAMVEVTHWYENVLFMSWVGLFFVWGSWIGILVAVIVALTIYFLEILIDSNFARVKWQAMLKWSWLVTLVFCTINIVVLIMVS
ncbi:MAG: NADH-quinone oxidoreductase subunit H [Coriobacteriaceae bacterium]|nr:NADH-quinone oxidoreductase subunit H [Coriobacteriaceae bacterium]